MRQYLLVFFTFAASITSLGQSIQWSDSTFYYAKERSGLLVGLTIISEDSRDITPGARVGYYYQYGLQKGDWSALNFNASVNLDIYSIPLTSGVAPNIRTHLHLGIVELGVGYFLYAPFMASTPSYNEKSYYTDWRFELGFQVGKFQVLLSSAPGLFSPRGPDYVPDSMIQLIYFFE